MHVTNVRVSFLREKQPAQYEKAAPAVEFVATLDEGDDHEATARQLMIDATSIVYAGIGYDVPAKVAKALVTGVATADLSVATKTVEAPTETSETPEETPEDKPKTKPRGRPVGSKNTGPKKETAAAKRKREAAEAAAKDSDGIPGDDEVPGDEPKKDSLSTGEARVGPDDDPADHDIPGDDEVPAEKTETEFTAKDLHTMIMSHVSATPQTLSVANGRTILAHFKVARAQDLTPEQVIKGKDMVEKMVEAQAAS